VFPFNCTHSKCHIHFFGCCNILYSYNLFNLMNTDIFSNFIYHSVRCTQNHKALNLIPFQNFFYFIYLRRIHKKCVFNRRNFCRFFFGRCAGYNFSVRNKQAVINYSVSSVLLRNHNTSVTLSCSTRTYKCDNSHNYNTLILILLDFV